MCRSASTSSSDDSVTTAQLMQWATENLQQISLSEIAPGGTVAFVIGALPILSVPQNS